MARVMVRTAVVLLAIYAPALPLIAQDLQSAGPITMELHDEITAQSVAWQPPPARTQPSSERTSPPPRRTTRSSQTSSLRLASVPKMFGDVQFNGSQIGYVLDTRDNSQVVGVIDIPLAGGARRLKIGENNGPLPEDRVVFFYNHFHNAINISELRTGEPAVRRSTHVDRYTFGFEKTYWDQMASLEIRMPVVSSFDFTNSQGDMAINGGSAGNLSLISKYLLYADDGMALAAGFAVDLPTGSDVSILTEETILTVNNDAVHLLPFLGLAVSPDEMWFATFFAQLDFAANGNDVTGTDIPDDVQYNDQNLLYLDLGTGLWLLRDPVAPKLTGIAAIAELHYTSTIQDTDVVSYTQFDPDSPNLVLHSGTIANQFNRIDVLNITGGFHFELDEATSLRVAAVAPLGRGDDERFFDTEMQVQFNQRY